MAWAIPLSSRRLFLTLAATAALALAVSGATASWVALRNNNTIADARDSGLALSSTVTEFSTRLAALDADAATMLLAEGEQRPVARSGNDPEMQDTGRSLAGYHPHLVLAARALVDAGLVGTEDDQADLRTLNDGLVRYNGLVETARANTQEGSPEAAAGLDQARTIAQSDLLPVADRLRRSGEQRVAGAADSVGGPVSAAAVGLLALATLVLLAAALVAAGRSRRLAHPALIAATAAAAGALVLMTTGIWSQSRELREAATTDIDAYVAANENAAGLSDLRVFEVSAVAREGPAEATYEDFYRDAGELMTRLDEPDEAGLRTAVQGYVDEVEAVDASRAGGSQQTAAESALQGASATQFAVADDAASIAVTRTLGQLEDRFDAVSDAGVPPLLPLVFAMVAAGLAAGGIVARGRRYR